MIEVPTTAIELAKRFEGFHRVARADPGRAQPYICPAGYWTIGYGHLCDRKHPPITEAEAEVYLARDGTGLPPQRSCGAGSMAAGKCCQDSLRGVQRNVRC